MADWQPIETAPRGWVRVSMRDVCREPPEWIARREIYTTPRKRPYRPIERELWMADDGLVCAPTHWMPLPAPPAED